MGNYIYNDNFYFGKLSFKKYKYTNNLKGSPANYIAYMLKGSAKIVGPDKMLTVDQGDVFLIPYKLPYQSYWYGEDDIEFISIGFIDTGSTENIVFDLQKINCTDKLKSIILSIPTEGSFTGFKALSIFYELLFEIKPYIKYFEKQSKTQMIVDKAKAFIADNLNCTVSDIARYCYISEPYLFLCFKQNENCTPNEYRLKLLCRYGVELLVTTDRKVDEISSDLGLSSASHLRKILKKYTGMTPSEIRKNREV